MLRKIISALAFAFTATAGFAQSAPQNPPMTYGMVPTVGQWVGWFQQKNDVLGYTAANRGGDTFIGPLTTAPSNSSFAGFTVSQGVAPTSPSNGNIWLTTSGLFVQVGGTTVGPLVGSGGGGILPVASGGTGASSLTAHGILLGEGTSAITPTAVGTAGQLLLGQSGTTDPAFKSASGDISAISAAGAVTVASIGGNPLGTGPNDIVQLNSSSQLPAVDGSQLINVNAVTVPVRQTVLSGPQSGGQPSYIPATSASLSITSQNISTGSNALVVTSANGFSASGQVNTVGVATSNQTWGSLTASSVDYLGETVSSGALTTLSTAIAPIYQYGGTISVTNGQYTFDELQQKMFLGNGSTASQVNVVFVGEVTTSSSAVTSAVAYAYQGYFDSGYTSTLPSTAVTTTYNANLGVFDANCNIWLKNLTTDNGYAVGNVISTGVSTQQTTSSLAFPITVTINSTRTVSFITSTNAAFVVENKTTGNGTSLTAANWAFKTICRRTF